MSRTFFGVVLAVLVYGSAGTSTNNMRARCVYRLLACEGLHVTLRVRCVSVVNSKLRLAVACSIRSVACLPCGMHRLGGLARSLVSHQDNGGRRNTPARTARFVVVCAAH